MKRRNFIKGLLGLAAATQLPVVHAVREALQPQRVKAPLCSYEVQQRIEEIRREVMSPPVIIARQSILTANIEYFNVQDFPKINDLTERAPINRSMIATKVDYTGKLVAFDKKWRKL